MVNAPWVIFRRTAARCRGQHDQRIYQPASAHRRVRAAIAIEHIADKTDITHNELRHRVELFVFHQMAAAGKALHPKVAVIALDAPATR
jgi:hypothetical protein